MKFSNPEVEIIVLNWNGREDTLQCLSSVQKLNYAPYHVTVVDNGSTDGSVEAILKEYRGSSWLSVIRNRENLGYTGGNNMGIRKALQRGAQFIWLLNNDTCVEPESLSRLVEAAENDIRIGLSGPKILQMEQPERIYAMGGKLNWWFPWADRGEDGKQMFPERGIVDVDFLSGAALLVRRKFVEHVGPLDERFFFYWEENDWCERGKKAGYRIVLVPEAVVYHRGGGSSGRGWNPFTAYYLVRNWILFMRKHARARYWITFPPFLGACMSYWIVKALWRRDLPVVRSFFAALVWHLRNPRIGK